MNTDRREAGEASSRKEQSKLFGKQSGADNKRAGVASLTVAIGHHTMVTKLNAIGQSLLVLIGRTV